MENKINGKIYVYFNKEKYNLTGIKSYYVGQTIQTIEERAGLNGNNYIRNSGNSKFSRAIKKWGWDAFTAILLEDNISTHTELNSLEMKYIEKYDSYNNGYNSTLGGDGALGCIITEETRQKISNSNKRKVYSPELQMLFDGLKDAAEYVKLKSPDVISKCCNGKLKSAGSAFINGKRTKLTWRYALESDYTNDNNTNEIIINKTFSNKKVYCPELGLTFKNLREASDYVGLKSICNISAVCLGTSKSAGTAIIDGRHVDLTWKYIDKDSNEILSDCSSNKVQINKVTTKRKVYCPELNMTFNTVTDAANYINLKSTSNISKCCSGSRKTAGSYSINGNKAKLTWKYIDID